MKASKITSNGRVTIPADLRKKYSLTPGRRVKIIDEEQCIKVIPLVTPNEIKVNIGFLGKDGPSLLKALMEEKKSERTF
jgi:AbrB family looped-hinge helix DNA binding protein